jgi:hypothetical protein
MLAVGIGKTIEIDSHEVQFTTQLSLMLETLNPVSRPRRHSVNHAQSDYLCSGNRSLRLTLTPRRQP